jgi:serine/threonine-protein kinase RsbT
MAAQPIRSDRLPIRSSEDVVLVRQCVRKAAIEVGLTLVDQTKIVTAASEIARNTLIHGGGGWASIELVHRMGRQGVRATFEDTGPGIADIPRAMQDGFMTAGGLGLGLGGAKRLCNDFELVSTPGQGTRISLTRWKA